MPTKTFRFTQLADLRAEGVGSMHASFTLSLNIAEDDVKEGKKLSVSAHMLCNAAKAYGSGKIVPWCTVINNIDHKKYVLDAKGKSFVLSQDAILIGSSDFTIPYKGNVRPAIDIQAGYVLDTGYTGVIVPFPKEMKRKILLNEFKR
jgi:hypothetical protein